MKNGRYVINEIERWFKNDLEHREDGPASIHPDGNQYWYKEGEWHREDGPAILIHSRKEYWIDNKQTTKFNVFLIALSKSLDLNEFWK